jgi:hypothetical protein
MGRVAEPPLAAVGLLTPAPRSAATTAHRHAHPCVAARHAALVARSADQFAGWGTLSSSPPAPRPASARRQACAARTSIPGSAHGRPASDHIRPGGLIDKDTKGKRVRLVPIIGESRPLVQRRLDIISEDPMARLFTGPRGGRISTAVLRDATHWDQVVSDLGYSYLRRHHLRHTGLTWRADAGVSVHVLRKIAGHGVACQRDGLWREFRDRRPWVTGP